MRPVELISTLEAAEYLAERGLRLSDQTLRRWAAERRVRHVLLPSGQVRFRPEDLDALLDPIEPEEAAS